MGSYVAFMGLLILLNIIGWALGCAGMNRLIEIEMPPFHGDGMYCIGGFAFPLLPMWFLRAWYHARVLLGVITFLGVPLLAMWLVSRRRVLCAVLLVLLSSLLIGVPGIRTWLYSMGI